MAFRAHASSRRRGSPGTSLRTWAGGIPSSDIGSILISSTFLNPRIRLALLWDCNVNYRRLEKWLSPERHGIAVAPEAKERRLLRHLLTSSVWALSVSSDKAGDLVRSSETCAKVDNALVPNGSLYMSPPIRVLRVFLVTVSMSLPRIGSLILEFIRTDQV
jgi:hypothetical protein